MMTTLNVLVSWKYSSDPDWLLCMFRESLYFYFLDLVVSLCTPLFMEHTRVQFIEERHTGGKLLQMCISLAAVQSWRRAWLVVTSWTAACQSPLSSTISRSLLKFMSIELGMLYNHLVLCRPLLLLPSVFANVRVFSSQLALHIRWPKCWAFSFSISWLFTSDGQSAEPSAPASVLPLFRVDLLQDGLASSPCSPRDSQESSPKRERERESSLSPQFKSVSFWQSAFFTLYLWK